MDKIQKYPKTTSAQVRVDSEGNTLEYALAAINSAINGKATPDELELVKTTLESEIAAKASTTDVIDNELTQAAALAEMSQRIDDIEVPEGGGGMTETTYADLKALRDAGTLTPGAWYRITDYQCTTIQEGTTSAGNQFDIIVRADSASVLNENAYAALHEGDTYFADCKLEAWRLKYCLDNDTDRFAWATEGGTYIETGGQKALYYKKSIIINEPNSSTEEFYIWDGTKSYIGFYIATDKKDYTSSKLYACSIDESGNIIFQNDYSSSLEYFNFVDTPSGCGVIYFMKDEFNNECPYDFKNIKYYRYKDSETGQLSEISTSGSSFYTFSEGNESNDIDRSKDIDCYVTNNIIKKYIYGTTQYLNNICLIYPSGSWHFNLFEGNCYNCTIGRDVNNSYLGKGCNNIIINNYCCNNIIHNNCNNITFLKNYCSNAEIKGSTKYVALTSDGTTSYSTPLQNIVVYPSKSGTEDEQVTITIPSADLGTTSTIQYGTIETRE